MLPLQRGPWRRQGDGECPRVPPPVGVLLPPQAPVGRPARRESGGGPGGDRRFLGPTDRKGRPRVGAGGRRGGEGEQRLLPPSLRSADGPPGLSGQRGRNGRQPEGCRGTFYPQRRPVLRGVDLLDAAERGRGEGPLPRERRPEMVRERGGTAAAGVLFRSGDAGDGRWGGAHGHQRAVERRAVGKSRQSIFRVRAGGGPWYSFSSYSRFSAASGWTSRSSVGRRRRRKPGWCGSRPRSSPPRRRRSCPAASSSTVATPGRSLIPRAPCRWGWTGSRRGSWGGSTGSSFPRTGRAVAPGG